MDLIIDGLTFPRMPSYQYLAVTGCQSTVHSGEYLVLQECFDHIELLAHQRMKRGWPPIVRTGDFTYPLYALHEETPLAVRRWHLGAEYRRKTNSKPELQNPMAHLSTVRATNVLTSLYRRRLDLAIFVNGGPGLRREKFRPVLCTVDLAVSNFWKEYR